MKIAVATGGNIPTKFAHSFSVMKMAGGFSELQNDVEVIAPLSLPLLYNKIKIGDLHKFYGISKKIKVKLIPVFSLSALKNSNNFRGFGTLAAKYCKKKEVDLAYCRNYRIAYHCVKMRVPTVVETHTTNYKHPDLKKIYEVSSDSSFKGLITISETIKKEHAKRGFPEEKILVLEDGVDLKRFKIKDDRYYWREKLGLPINKKLVVYCGHLYEEKGIEHILLTAQKLRDENIIFILVGGWKKDVLKWKKYCKNNQINNAIFTGFVKNYDVPKYLKSADVLIMPYKMDTVFNVMDINTTSPLKLFEYMASMRPIVSTDIPTISKIVKHGESALLADPDDVARLKEYVIELVNDRELSNKISKKAYNDVKKFAWKGRSKKILSLI